MARARLRLNGWLNGRPGDGCGRALGDGRPGFRGRGGAGRRQRVRSGEQRAPNESQKTAAGRVAHHDPPPGRVTSWWIAYPRGTTGVGIRTTSTSARLFWGRLTLEAPS